MVRKIEIINASIKENVWDLLLLEN